MHIWPAKSLGSFNSLSVIGHLKDFEMSSNPVDNSEKQATYENHTHKHTHTHTDTHTQIDH